MFLFYIVTASTAAAAPDAAAVHALGALLLQQGGSSTLIAATCFAVGSTLYSYLFLRARSIPVPLAWMAVFEVTLALWLIVKGVAMPANR